jgi:hypothetical protein
VPFEQLAASPSTIGLSILHTPNSVLELTDFAQFQEPFHPVHRGPVQPTPQQPQVQALDSISFYTRPTQPSAGHSTVGRVPSESHHHRHHHPHSQPPHYRPFYQPQAQQQLNSPGNDDEGGFNEARRFRTLPAASNAKRADYR